MLSSQVTAGLITGLEEIYGPPQGDRDGPPSRVECDEDCDQPGPTVSGIQGRFPERLTREGVPSPAAYDPARNPHRSVSA